MPFCDIPLIALSGKSHATTRLIGCAPHRSTALGIQD